MMDSALLGSVPHVPQVPRFHLGQLEHECNFGFFLSYK